MYIDVVGSRTMLIQAGQGDSKGLGDVVPRKSLSASGQMHQDTAVMCRHEVQKRESILILSQHHEYVSKS